MRKKTENLLDGNLPPWMSTVAILLFHPISNASSNLPHRKLSKEHFLPDKVVLLSWGETLKKL